MKLLGLTLVGGSSAIFSAGTIKRTTQGDWVNQFYNSKDPLARAAIDGAKGFRPLASMVLYMSGFGRKGADPETKDTFEKRLKKLEKAYTNYGCYCWIDGVDAGVIGGGATKDVSDHHCKELYRCYKCVNTDYARNYTDVSYTVSFEKDANNNRVLDCAVNSKQDAENICECDKRFAENIAKNEENCENEPNGADDMYGSYCQSKEFRTTTGGGAFEPRDQCDKQFHGHQKYRCCGIYPNRYPYDDRHKDCCRTKAHDGDGNPFEIFTLLPSNGQCEANDGDVVVSVDGDPHSYINANRNN